MFRDTPSGKSYSVSNPLSAIESPGSSKFKIPLCRVIFWSLLPAYKSDKCQAPLGAIPTSPLAVLWCLQL